MLIADAFIKSIQGCICQICCLCSSAYFLLNFCIPSFFILAFWHYVASIPCPIFVPVIPSFVFLSILNSVIMLPRLQFHLSLTARRSILTPSNLSNLDLATCLDYALCKPSSGVSQLHNDTCWNRMLEPHNKSWSSVNKSAEITSKTMPARFFSRWRRCKGGA